VISGVARIFIGHIPAGDAAAVGAPKSFAVFLERAAPESFQGPSVCGQTGSKPLSASCPKTPPIVVVSASVESEDLKITMNACTRRAQYWKSL